MSIKQKLTDVITLVKKERRYQFIAGLAALGIVFMLLSPAPPPKGPAVKKDSKKIKLGTKMGGPDEVYKDLTESLTARVDQTEKRLDGIEKATGEIKDEMVTNNERIAEIMKKVLERVAEAPSRGQTNASQQGGPGGNGSGPVDVNDVSQPSGPPAEPDTMTNFGNPAETTVVPPPAPAMEKVAFIGAGDSVRIKLLAGVNAPTDGTPYPVVFKLISEIHGPDGSALPLGEARLIAAAQGSLTDSRALFRLTTLNVRMPNGQRKVFDVDGWVVGEDGIRGMEGILIDPIGKAIGAEMMIGTLKGVGDGLAAAQTTSNITASGIPITTLTGDIAAYAAGKGLAEGTDKWSAIIAERVAKLVPQVQVFSGREATAVFAKSVAVRGLMEQLEDEDSVLSTVD